MQLRYRAAMSYHCGMNLDKLRARLQGANLSALARQIDIDVRTLRRIKNSGSSPTLETAEKIAAGLRRASRGAK
jgi:transcriptional regulator with XRE-family HTH domain